MEIDAYKAAHDTLEMIEWLQYYDFEEPLKIVRDALGKQEETSFEQKIDPDGEPWPERKHEYPWPMLVKTGFLYLSVGDQVMEATIEDRQLILPADSASLPTYAEAQDQGTDKIDPRPFLGFGQATIDIAVEAGVEAMNRRILEL